MADYTVALQAKAPEIQPIDWKGWAALGLQQQQTNQSIAASQQQISASKSSQALTEAQIPGAQADSVTAQQKSAAAVQDQGANDLAINLASKPQYQTKDPASGGTIVDYNKLYGDLAKSFPQQAVKMAANQFDTVYKGAQASEQTATTAGKWLDFGNKLIQTTANIVDKSPIPADQKGKFLADTIEKQAAHYPDAFAVSPYVITSPAKPASTDANGNPVPAKPATSIVPTLLHADDVTKIANGAMDPLTTAKLQISQNELALAQRVASPEYKAAISTVPSSETRVAALTGAAAGESYRSDLNAGINAKVTGLPTAPLQIADSVWQKYLAQGGAYAQKEAALQAYNTAHGTQFSIPLNGLAAVDKLLSQESAKVGAVTQTQRQIATQSFVPGTSIPAVGQHAASTSPAVAAPTQQTVPAVAEKRYSPAESKQLPKGTIYTGMDGQKRRVD